MAPQNYKTAPWGEWELLSESAPDALSWASRGGDGSGKSHFACTAPDPIFVAAFDPHGMARVNPDVRRGKEIRVKRYMFNPGPYKGNRKLIADAAEPIWNQFVDDYRMALRHCRTILLDREDMAYALVRYATFGGLRPEEGDKRGALNYGDINEEYVSLIQEAKAASVNLGLLQGLDDNWVAKLDPQKGRMVNYMIGKKPDGHKKVPDHVDITIDHRWDEAQKEYVVKLVKFPNKEEKDQEYPNLTFLQMATLAFPETSEDDWLTRKG